MKTKLITTIMIMLLLASILTMAFVAPATGISPPLGLVGRWHFDEGIGSTASDSSGNANHGTLSGGKFGNALDFNGVNSYVIVPSSTDLYGMNQLTVEAWIYLRTNDWEVALLKWVQGNVEDGASYSLEIYQQRLYGLIKTNGQTYVEKWGAGAIVTINTWHHVALVWDGTASPGVMNLYMDGVLQATISHARLSGIIDNTPTIPVYIGGWSSLGTWFLNGKIDEIRISNSLRYTALSYIIPTSAFTLPDVNTLALWHFDESVSNIARDATTKHNGTISNAKWAGPEWVDGKFGKALRFDGVDDYVWVADDPSLDFAAGDSFTLEAWIKTTDASSGYNNIIRKDNYLMGEARALYLIAVYNPGGKLRGFIYDKSGNWKFVESNTPVNDGVWHHVVFVRDVTGDKLRLYIDGKEDGTPITDPTIDTFENLGWVAFGAYANPNKQGEFFDGIIDEARIWERMLSIEEIKKHAWGLVGEWDFDEGSGTTAYDSSGFGNDGTINGGATFVPGKLGSALNFDGTGYVNCGLKVDDVLSNAITLEAWIKPTGKQRGGIISSDVTYYAPHKGYDFFLWDDGTNGRLYTDFGNGIALGRKWFDIPNTSWYNQWHHVAASWNGNNVRLYVDGMEVTSLTYTGSYSDPSRNTLIGAISYTSVLWKFSGIIDEVRIWNQALVPVKFDQTGLDSTATGKLVVTVSDPISLNYDDLPYIMMVKPSTAVSFTYEDLVPVGLDKQFALTGVSHNSPQTVIAPLTITGTYVAQCAPVPDAGGPYVVDEGTAVSFDASASTDPDGDSLEYRWDFDNDGTWDTEWSSSPTASHTWYDDYAGTAKVEVTDKVFWRRATASVTVSNVAPVVDAGPDATINEGDIFSSSGSFTDPGADTWTATVDYGDGTGVSPLTLNPDKTFSLSHIYVDDDEDDQYTVTVAVTDDDGGVDSDTVQVTVNNVAPIVGPLTITPTLVKVGDPITATGTFTDPGTLDTHTAAWDWGDGTTSVGTVTESGGSGSVSGSHAYTSTGVYTVTLTVTDDDGGSDTAIFEYVVVYDPSAGFVTGGGWINSPAGAYTAGPTLEGKATFGFVSKYQKGTTVPTGNTEFIFHVAGLKFKSTSYEWLVIAGARAQYKGSGTINGAGDYGFMLTAIDGQINGGGGTDKFRIKIWDRTTDTVIYDNQVGETDDYANPTTAIAGGSIVIHTK